MKKENEDNILLQYCFIYYYYYQYNDYFYDIKLKYLKKYISNVTSKYKNNKKIHFIIIFKDILSE